MENAFADLEQRYTETKKAARIIESRLNIALRRQDDLLAERRLIEQQVPIVFQVLRLNIHNPFSQLAQMNQLRRELMRCQREKQQIEERCYQLVFFTNVPTSYFIHYFNILKSEILT